MLKVLLLSAYHARSHAYWCEGLQQHFPEYRWQILHLPARYFAWRVRGNPLSWYQQPELSQSYDLIVATSMVDLATLRGLHPQLSKIPTLLYFHENQFAYPGNADSNSVLEAQMVSMYSAMSADTVLFNSAYNRDTWFAGLDALLSKLPDHKPDGLIEKLRKKSACLPVPLADDVLKANASQRENNLLNIVWNHRWEYDKGPSQLLQFVKVLPQERQICFHIIGQSFRRAPAEFEALKIELNKRNGLGRWGFVENRQEYLQLLAKCDIALSTALHDFQGLALMEAVASGCKPLVPDRLAYREYIPESFRYPSLPEKPEEEAQAAVEQLEVAINTDFDPQLSEVWRWAAQRPAYREVFESLAALEVSCAAR